MPLHRPFSKAEYAAASEELLARIQHALAADGRFHAAWLGGSYGRGEQDEVSDIDLCAVVGGGHAAELCARGAMLSAGSPPARARLFAGFGAAANIHENHYNAPPGGAFSSVLYRDPPVIVDWTLLPAESAARPAGTRLLFDALGQYASPAAGPGEQGADPGERAAAHNMMALGHCEGASPEAISHFDSIYTFLQKRGLRASCTGDRSEASLAMTRVFDISSLDDSPILGAPTEMAPRHWRFPQERARLRKSERAARMCERGAFFWMMAAVCAKYIVRAGSGSTDMIQSANSMLNFTARAAAEISALSGSEPSAETGVLDPDRAALSARLRELCERVTGCGVDPSPMQAVAEILSLGEA